MTAKAEARYRARLAILAAYENYRRTRQARDAAAALAADYNAGRIAALAGHREAVPRVGVSTIFGWLRRLREGSEDALRERHTGRRTTIWELHPELREAVEEMLRADPWVPATKIDKAVAPLAAKNGWRVPARSTVSRLVKELRPARPRPAPIVPRDFKLDDSDAALAGLVFKNNLQRQRFERRVTALRDVEAQSRDIGVTRAVAAVAAERLMSESTLHAWIKRSRDGGLEALVDSFHGSNKRPSVWETTPELRRFVGRAFRDNPDVAAEQVWSEVAVLAGKKGWPVPSSPTIGRRLRFLRAKAKLPVKVAGHHSRRPLRERYPALADEIDAAIAADPGVAVTAVLLRLKEVAARENLPLPGESVVRRYIHKHRV